MKDYFGEFLLNQNPSRFGAEATKPRASEMSGKSHFTWFLIAVSVGVLSWKGSNMYTKHVELKKESESEQL